MSEYIVTNIWQINLKRMLFALLFTLCTACTGGGSTFSLQLTAYNHTASSVGSFSVEIPGGEGGSSGFLGAGEGGGGFVCCVSVPSKWRAGMAVTVEWNTVVDGKEVTKNTVVKIPEYNSNHASRLSVHFLANGGVRAFVTPYALRHPNYPFKGADAKMPPLKL